MNWRDFAAWLDLDQDADLAKCRRHEIKTLYIDPRSRNAKEQVAKIDGGGLSAGIYVAANWFPGATPEGFVDRVRAWVRVLIPMTSPGATNPRGHPAMLDLEGVTKAWIRDVVAFYRLALPVRETAYTGEPFKDGTVVPLGAMVAAGFHFYPQTYLGDMSPVDTAAPCLDLARWGVPADRIHPFYDGARLPPYYRDGAAFTLGRIP